MQVSLNNEQRLFVLSAGSGYFSCLGFDHCYKESLALALAMNLGDEFMPKEAEIGSLKQYEQYCELIRKANGYPGFLNSTWFNPETPLAVRHALDNARVSGARLRLFYGDVETGRDWLSEFDVVGRIGRSSGTLKVPLLIANSRSTGGPAILDHCVIRIIDVGTKRELYRSKNYQVPVFELLTGEQALYQDRGYVAHVKVNGVAHANFKKISSAERWIAFMKGERMNK